MRATLLCLCFVLAGAAAERESITLADGRTLVGYYDEDRGTMTLDGGKVVVQVSAETVKARGPATSSPPVVVGKLKVTTDAPQSSVQPPPLDAFKKLTDDYDRQTFALVKSWLDGAGLELLPEPKLPDDPRQSEREAASAVHAINATIVHLKEVKMKLPDVTDNRIPEFARTTLRPLLDEMVQRTWLDYVKRGGR